MNNVFRTQRSIALPIAITLSILLYCGSVQAAYVFPEWERGSEGSSYLEWDSFVKPPGATNSINTIPDIGSNNIQSSVLTEHIGGAFVTSSGNLYTPFVMSDYTLVVTGDDNGPSPIAQDVQVVLQLGTWSRQIKDGDITLNGVTGDIVENDLGEFVDPVWGTYTRFWYVATWDVAASSIYQFAWLFDQTSTSLDAVVLDMYSSGEVAGLLDYALLPILPAIPGSTLFDGITQLYAEDFIGHSALASRLSSPVPVPASAPLLLSGLLLLGSLMRKRKTQKTA